MGFCVRGLADLQLPSLASAYDSILLSLKHECLSSLAGQIWTSLCHITFYLGVYVAASFLQMQLLNQWRLTPIQMNQDSSV